MPQHQVLRIEDAGLGALVATTAAVARVVAGEKAPAYMVTVTDGKAKAEGVWGKEMRVGQMGAVMAVAQMGVGAGRTVQ